MPKNGSSGSPWISSLPCIFFWSRIFEGEPDRIEGRDKFRLKGAFLITVVGEVNKGFTIQFQKSSPSLFEVFTRR